MRADLQALIDYTGLSNAEAAKLIGIGHEALSRKLAGKERYEVRQSEIDALAKLAALQDNAVVTTLNAIDALNREHRNPKDEPPVCVLISYRSIDDMLDEEEWPSASAQRMVLARIKAEAGMKVDLILFDRRDYEKWLAGRLDTRAARLEWANVRSEQRKRLAIEWGVDRSRDGRAIQHALGWAVWRTGPSEPGPLINSGETEIPKP